MDSSLDVRLPQEKEPDQLDQLLAGKFAFVEEPAVAEKWTFYDTFDWRLYNQSMVLRQSSQENISELFLEPLSSGESLASLPGGLTSTPLPDFAWDLPDSPLRNRLEPIVKMRALLPLADIYTRTRTYRILNKDEKTVARLVTTQVRSLAGKSEILLATYLSLRPVRGYPKYSRKLAKYLFRAGQETSMNQDLYFSALRRVGKKPGSYSGKLNIRLKAQNVPIQPPKRYYAIYSRS